MLQVFLREKLHGSNFDWLRRTGVYDFKEDANKRHCYHVNIARSVLKVMVSSRHGDEKLEIPFTTDPTYATSREIAQLHSFIASARSLHMRLLVADESIKGIWGV